MWQYLVFTYRRTLRRWRRKLRTVRSTSTRYIDRHIWGKWHQLGLVRRLLFVWFGLITIMAIGLLRQTGSLSRLAEVIQPLSGGSYREAAVGTVKVLNPILPESGPSSDINRLIYSGLTQYDNRRRLVADLATSWQVSADGKAYTFHLRHGIKWHDGVPFTSADVAFTMAAIQNPDTRSPLAASWQGVTIATPDDFTVVFNLPSAFTPFMDSTTIGIVPRHLLEFVNPSTLREASYNQAPIGTGPFKLTSFSSKAGEVVLAANSYYYARRPRLDQYIWRLYDTSPAALQAYARHEVDAISRIQPDDLANARKLANLNLANFSLPTESILFFRQGDKDLSDIKVRQALAASLDRSKLLTQAGDVMGVPLTQPLLPGQIGYTTKYFTAGYNPSKAHNDLATLKPLSLTLVTLADPNYAKLAAAIQSQWHSVGVKLQIKEVSLRELQQTYIRPRNYQLLLYGLNIGADPDVYAYWHSSQASDPGLNLSQYSSPTADRALESGRIKTDREIRQGKYDTFLRAWNADVPAVVIGSTPYLYGVSRAAHGHVVGQIVQPSDRFYRVERWTIRTRFGRRDRL